MAEYNVVKDEVAGEEEYEWLKSNPKIMKAGKMICRLVKDIVGHEVWYLNPKKNKIIRYIDNWILIYHLNIEPILKILHSL